MNAFESTSAKKLNKAIGKARACNMYPPNKTELIEKDYQDLLEMAFREDQVEGDVTTLSIFQEPEHAKAYIETQEDAILAGLPLVKAAFLYLDKDLIIRESFKDGALIRAKEVIVEIEGNVQSILRAERIALNFLGMLSGIATKTAKAAAILKPFGIMPLDTRKTIPAYRSLEKYAVSIGGGKNHRLDLSTLAMFKDNHIAKAKSISRAVELFRAKYQNIGLEIEVENLEMLKEALASDADLVLLDNMNPALMKEATAIIANHNKEKNRKVTAEASGGFNLENLHTLKNTGVDYVSMGSLTSKIDSIDFSLEISTN